MHLSVRHFALATVVSLAPLAAQAADYTLQEVRVHGRVADTVTAISHGGIIGGSFTDNKGDHPGFLLNNGAVTVLRPRTFFQGERFEPFSITDNGLVAGIADVSGLIWNNGRFQYSDGMSIDQNGPLRPFIGISAHHEIAYDSGGQDGHYDTHVGRRPPYQTIAPCDLPHIAAINRQGVASGDCTTYPIGGSIFTYENGKTTLFQGPGNTPASDGLINDHGAIAGTFSDGQGLHGMILRNSKYTTFDAPSPPKEMKAVALSNTDIVVGTYTDASGAYHGYSWHKGVFSELVKASPTVAVTVTGVSDAGDVTLNLEDLTTSVTTPYIAHCHGKDC